MKSDGELHPLPPKLPYEAIVLHIPIVSWMKLPFLPTWVAVMFDGRFSPKSTYVHPFQNHNHHFPCLTNNRKAGSKKHSYHIPFSKATRKLEVPNLSPKKINYEYTRHELSRNNALFLYSRPASLHKDFLLRNQVPREYFQNANEANHIAYLPDKSVRNLPEMH